MDRCLAKEPRERYESTRDLYEDLRSLRDHLSDEYGTSELPGARPDKVRLSQVWKTMALTVGAVSMLVAAGMWSLGRKNAGADLAGYRYTPLAIDAKEHAYPHWSPDGKAIAFSASSQGHYHAFVRYLASPVATDLGIRRDHALPQRWSADSKRIVVFATSPNSTPQNPTFGFYTVSAIGGGDPAFIMDSPKDSAASDTSPDTRTIAIFSRREGSRLTVFFSSPAGSPWRRYQPDPFATTIAYNGSSLRFAPDGTKLLLLYTGDKGEPEAWVLPFPPASGKPHRVLEALPTQTVLNDCSWMPDSRHFVFSMTAGGQNHLWLADIGSNERYQITTGMAAEINPAVSPDGRTLAFNKIDSHLNVVSVSLLDYTSRSLVGTERNDRMAAWAARTDQLAYVTDRNGPMEVWIRLADGSNRPVVTKDNFPNSRTQSIMNPSLSPDGSRIIFVRQGPDGATRNWIMSLSDGVPHRLNDSATDTELGGTWSPDGRRFAYIQVKGGSWDLEIDKVGSAEPPLLIRKDTEGSLPDWSPTGEWISFQDKTGWNLISPDGKTIKALGKISTAHLAFSKDGKQLYGMREEPANATLFSLDPLTGRVKDLHELGHELAPSSDYEPSIRFSLATDGKSIAYSVADFRSTIWLLEGFQQPSLLQRVFASRSLDHNAPQ